MSYSLIQTYCCLSFSRWFNWASQNDKFVHRFGDIAGIFEFRAVFCIMVYSEYCCRNLKSHCSTSNVTAVTEVGSTSARLFAGTWRPLMSVTTLVLCCDYFSSSIVVSRSFSATFVSDFIFSRPPMLSWPMRKIAYLITHSPSLFHLSSSRMVSRAFSALCVYSKFGHHPRP